MEKKEAILRMSLYKETKCEGENKVDGFVFGRRYPSIDRGIEGDAKRTAFNSLWYAAFKRNERGVTGVSYLHYLNDTDAVMKKGIHLYITIEPENKDDVELYILILTALKEGMIVHILCPDTPPQIFKSEVVAIK